MLTSLQKPDMKTTNQCRVLIVDDVHPVLPEGLSKAGFEVLYVPENKPEEIIQNLLPTARVVVVRSKFQLDESLLKRAEQLEVIARAGAGMDNIDEEYCRKHNILTINAGEANSEAVADHTLGMLLMQRNYLHRADSQVRAGIWNREQNRGHELAGKTMAVIGYGNTGKAVAKRLPAFGLKVLVYDKYLSNFGSKEIQEATMDQIFEEADLISFHIPLTAETKGMVNQNYLGAFKKNLVLLNLSRGGIVLTRDLVEALKSGKLQGACLDVLENEKLETLTSAQKIDFDYLRNAQNVVLAPHIGGWSFESYQKISEVLLKKLLEIHNRGLK